MSFPTPVRLLLKVLSNDVLMANLARGYIAGIQDLSNLAKRIDSDQDSTDCPNAIALEYAVRKFLSCLKEDNFSLEGLFSELFPLVTAHNESVENDSRIKQILEAIEAELGLEEHMEAIDDYEYAEI